MSASIVDDDVDVGHMQAFVDGSKIASLYSASKRGKEAIEGNFEDVEVIDAVRLVIAKLTSVNQEPAESRSSVEEVTQMLQAIEEKLEMQKVLGKSPIERVGGRIAFTPSRENTENDTSTPFMHHTLKSGQKSVIKVYMANQLDLNQSEFENYEEVIDKLSSTLDTVSMELQKVEEEKIRLNETLGQVTLERADYLASISSMEQLLDDSGKENDELLDRLDEKESLLKELNLKVTSLFEQTELLSNNKQSLEGTIEELSRSLEDTKSNLINVRMTIPSS